jgi:hypothetical protein
MPLSPQDYWRAFVHDAQQRCDAQDRSYPLPDGATPEHGKTHISMNELAQAFFHEYR